MKPRNGLKRSARTPQLIKAVKGRISRNPVRSMRKMAKELSVSEHTSEIWSWFFTKFAVAYGIGLYLYIYKLFKTQMTDLEVCSLFVTVC